MSSVSGARSDCDSCRSEGRHREVEYHSHQCHEFLCTQCRDYQKKFKMSRDHKVVTLSSLRGSRSVIGASDGIYDCNPCETEGRNREANHFCETCKEHFCNSCSNEHKKSKMSKDHKLRTVPTASQSSVSASQQTPPSDGLSKLSLSQHTAPSDNGSKSVTTATAPANTDQLDNMFNLKVKSSSKVNIRLPQDKRPAPSIFSCTFLPNGELLLVDRGNLCLKLLDRTLAVKNSFDLSPDRPWDVSVLDTNIVVVTFPDEKKLQFIQVSPSFSRGRSVQFHKRCFGVGVAGDKIYVGCKEDDTPGEVCVLDIRGSMVMKFGLNDTRQRFIGRYVAANTEGSRIYVSDRWTDTIMALTATGDILFPYKCNSDDVRGIGAMYVDSQSNILVCGLCTHNVQIITAAGNKYDNLLSSSDGLNRPLGIAYRPSDGTLVVGCLGQENLCVFKLA